MQHEKWRSKKMGEKHGMGRLLTRSTLSFFHSAVFCTVPPLTECLEEVISKVVITLFQSSFDIQYMTVLKLLIILFWIPTKWDVFEWLWMNFINLMNILLTEWSDLYVHWNAEGFTKWWFTCNHSWAWNVPCCFATRCESLFVVNSFTLNLMLFIIWLVDYLAALAYHLVFLLQAEQVSLCGFINMFIVIALALLWALLPTETALFAHWLQNRILKVSVSF